MSVDTNNGKLGLFDTLKIVTQSTQHTSCDKPLN